ncbi:MAG: hypothetical protein QW423_03485 [Candidatus Aenigmatarchaeota archaeon]
MKWKSLLQRIKEFFSLDEWEEEISLILLGLGGIIGLLFQQKEISMFCFGVLAGYLTKGHVEYRREH